MRDCGADCENRIVVGRHRRAVLGGPGAMKERLPPCSWPQMIFDKHVGNTRLFAF